jgi:glutathione S-transferase
MQNRKGYGSDQSKEVRMIKLFSMPGACSLAPHIVLKELGLPHEVKILKRGGDGWDELARYNPMKEVPTIVTEEGYGLAEGTAIMQYFDSKRPGVIFPQSGKDRFKTFEWSNFISSSLHKSFGPLFNPARVLNDESKFEAVRATAVERLKNVLQVAESRFSDEEFATGKQFTAVDAYLFTVLGWTKNVKVDITPYHKLSTFVGKVAKRPSVVAAMKAEGLI